MHLQLHKMHVFARVSHYAATISACQCHEHAI